MNPKELMIGNLVYRIDRRGEVHLPVEIPLQVLEIGIFESSLLRADKNPAQEAEWLKFQNGDLCGILLDDEKLLKWLGFEIRESQYGKNFFKGDFNFWKNDITDGRKYIFNLSHSDIDIRYVHQLQNLYFSLVGTELTCAPQS